MTGQMFFPEREMTVCFNGTQMATLQSYQVTCTADCEAVFGFGDGAPSGVARGGKRFALTLRRIYPILSGLQDGISLYELQNFTVSITHHKRVVTFSGCEWTSIRESVQPDAPVIEEMTLLAAGRTQRTTA